MQRSVSELPATPACNVVNSMKSAEPLGGRSNCARSGLWIASVRDNCARLFPELLLRELAIGSVSPNHHHARAGGDERLGGRETQTRRATDNDQRFAVQGEVARSTVVLGEACLQSGSWTP